MYYIVYLTTNLKSQINGTHKIYVGVHKTKNPYIFDGYLGCGVWVTKSLTYLHPKTPFQCAVKKYGTDAFTRETLYIYEVRDEAFRKEAEIVDKNFINLPHVYNATLGGVVAGMYGKELYQFDYEGHLIKKWDHTNDAMEEYGYSLNRFRSAVHNKENFLNSFWSATPIINLKEYRIVKSKSNITYLYSKEGKMLQEFDSTKECGEFLQISGQTLERAIYAQELVFDKYYISYQLTDEFHPKPRLQYKDLNYFIYNISGEFLGEYKGKQLLSFLHCYSWRDVRDIIELRNGWKKDFYISLTKIEKIPYKKLRHHLCVDVYDKFGNYIETLSSIKDVKDKYKVPAGRIKNLDLGDRTYKDFVFKFSKYNQ